MEIMTNGSTTVQQNYYMSNSISFERENGNNFLIHHAASLLGEFGWLFEDETTASYTWLIHPEKALSLPLISDEVTKGAFFLSRESLSLQVRNEQVNSAFHLTAVVGHETTLRFPQHGYIRAGISIGYDLERVPLAESVPANSGSESWHRIAIEAHLEGKIQL